MFTCSKVEEMFPRNKGNHDMEKRSLSLPDERALTGRLRRFAIPRMRRLLNKHEGRKGYLQTSLNFNPVNDGLICKSVSLRP